MVQWDYNNNLCAVLIGNSVNILRLTTTTTTTGDVDVVCLKTLTCIPMATSITTIVTGMVWGNSDDCCCCCLFVTNQQSVSSTTTIITIVDDNKNSNNNTTTSHDVFSFSHTESEQQQQQQQQLLPYSSVSDQLSIPNCYYNNNNCELVGIHKGHLFLAYRLLL